MNCLPENVSIVIPAKDEGENLRRLLPDLLKFVRAEQVWVVNDGSSDDTVKVCGQAGVHCVTHPYSKGNGAAIKSGARAATGDIIVFMDGDGQHDPAHIEKLSARLSEGYDMVVGARVSRGSQASTARWAANSFYNAFASWMTGHEVEDLTSGFRAVKASLFRKFLHLLPNGFSYPTTITMAFFRSGYSVAYEPVEVGARQGRSHVKLLRDGIRFLLIIFKIGTLFSPLKLFAPVSLSIFGVGLAYYGYTFTTVGRFTNMSGLMFTTAVIIFMMGLVSEQITSLHYSREE